MPADYLAIKSDKRLVSLADKFFELASRLIPSACAVFSRAACKRSRGDRPLDLIRARPQSRIRRPARNPDFFGAFRQGLAVQL